ncbi:zinc finger CCCH domain-containing protein 18-like [Elysia marginata]|uniref:Zinc finger CCCH domain-containing protein 18-like n=1 Tax=Elysia marginata TaxID=1093978 RepID=A0AAV4FRE6_9GAST|nr:zinc finger CCCH domain-containing protein 18-like [Elysia marginata]
MRQDRGSRGSPPPAPVPPPSSAMPVSSSSSSSRARAPVSPQKQPLSGLKSRGPEPSLAKTAPKLPSSGGSASMGGAGGASVSGSVGSGAKTKKSMSSRREELLKQLKAVEDAIARKKTKLT